MGETTNAMIQQIHLGVRARSEKDSKLLSRVLATLGLKHRDVESRGKRRSPCFFPPSVALEILAPGTGDADSDLELALSDPDSAAEILARMGLEITDDSSGPEPAHSARRFRLRLPGGTRLKIVGARITRRPATEAAVLEGGLSARGLRFAIVASRFNSFIVERLLLGALDALERAGAGRETIEIVRVPDSLEIPSTARRLAESKRYDAIICLGCLLRGDTAHYDVIANEVTRGIGQSAQETAMPHAFGVLTCDTLEQAIDRAGLKMGNKGFEAALAAIEMANLNQSLRGRTPSKNISGSASAKSGRRRSHASSSVATKRSRGKSRR